MVLLEVKGIKILKVFQNKVEVWYDKKISGKMIQILKEKDDVIPKKLVSQIHEFDYKNKLDIFH